ncbi:MAG TPA: hypothetical protein PLO62_01605 [Candidatus Hydrogenedentes bacterium]|nr:hypothetical protein [Candidatus Hydrogenedentota bacterium]HOS01467.1 hypothetical protein [Candidatus Hydrogenedentota bacterium]
MPRDAILAAAAVTTVLALVVAQIAMNARALPGAALPELRRLEDLTRQREWDQASQFARKLLLVHPYFRPLHAITAEIMFERGFPEFAIEHLAVAAGQTDAIRLGICLATAPEAGDACALLRSNGVPPTEDAVRDFVNRLEARYPESMKNPLARLRMHRLSAQGDNPLLTFWETAPPLPMASTDFVEAGRICGSLAFGALNPEPTPEESAALLTWLGAEPQDLPSCAVGEASATAIAVFAHGGATGNTYGVLSEARRRCVSTPRGWWFAVVDAVSGEVIRDAIFCFAPLTRAPRQFQDWIERESGPALLAGCASGEAVARMSMDARRLLLERFGLKALPAPDALQAYAFVACLSGGDRATEAVSLGADLPAALLLENRK